MYIYICIYIYIYIYTHRERERDRVYCVYTWLLAPSACVGAREAEAHRLGEVARAHQGDGLGRTENSLIWVVYVNACLCVACVFVFVCFMCVC